MTVIFLSNITSTKNQEICSYQLLLGCEPRLPASLRSFGEMELLLLHTKFKLNTKGTPCMFVGYSAHHAHAVCRKLNIEIGMIINLRDIIWVNEVHKCWIPRKVKNQFIDNDDDVIESKIQLDNKGQAASRAVTNQDDLKRMKIYRQLRQLEGSSNPDVTKLVEKIEQGKEILLIKSIFYYLAEWWSMKSLLPSITHNHEDPKVIEKAARGHQ